MSDQHFRYIIHVANLIS